MSIFLFSVQYWGWVLFAETGVSGLEIMCMLALLLAVVVSYSVVLERLRRRIPGAWVKLCSRP